MDKPAIDIRYIPHQEQRYDTSGDWWFDDENILQVRVSILPDVRMMEAIAIHEMVEALLCKHAGVDEDAVSAFDMKFERNRAPGNTDEPGDAPDAPYRLQHAAATTIEMRYVLESGLRWTDHDDAVNNLPDHVRRVVP